MNAENARMTKWTRGMFDVVIDGTCSAAWPFIVPAGADYDDSVAELNSVFLRKANAPRGVTYQERRSAFRKAKDYDETMAIAHLFAAAPDLYAILDEMVNYNGGSENALADEYVFQRAVAALSRARGEQA